MTIGAVSNYIVLVDLEPLDPVTGEIVIQRISSRDWLSSPAEGDVEYDGWLIGCNYGRSLVAPGRIRGQSVGCRGAITVANSWSDAGFPGRRLDHWHRLRWQHRRVTIRILEPGQALADAIVMLVGTVSAVEPEADRFVLSLRDRQELFRRKKLLVSTYPGTGGMNGGPELKGQRLPWGAGIVRKLPVVGVDVLVTGLWYDIIPGRQLHAVLSAEDGGGALTVSGSNPPLGGRYFVSAADGRIRLGIEPTYDVTVDARLDATGGYVSTHAGIMRRVALARAGLDETEIDDIAFADLDALQPAEIGLWVGPGEDPSIAETFDRICEGGGMWWAFTRFDRLAVGRLDAVDVTEETADLVLDEYDVAQGSLKRIASEAPPHKITMKYRRYLMTRDKGRVAAGLAETVKQELNTEWRQVVWDDPAVLAEYPGSEPLTIESLYDVEDDAADELMRLGDLYKRTPLLLTFATGMQGAMLDAGGTLWLRHPEQDLKDGKGFRVLSVDVDLMAGIVQGEIWRHDAD